jgi:hypothetical protein|nr:MAG TPA: hypothetical protein [Caudoviricetes sp.]
MDLLVDEQKQIFDVAVEDILKERGSAICLTDALKYAERAVVSALLSGKEEITLDLGHVVQTAEAQREVKALFKEYAADFISDLGIEAIDKDIYPDVKN